MLTSFHLSVSGNYVGEGDHEPHELTPGRRVKFTHFNYRITRYDGEHEGVQYCTVEDERTNSGITPRKRWT